jgi:hypothetical protein
MKKIYFLSFFVLIVFNSNFVTGQNSQPQWLTSANFEKSPNQWFQLRKSFKLKKTPKTSIIKIAADSKYWLWVNGELVVYEGMLKRGPNPNDTYYDELDLTPYLKKGKNTLAVLVWYFGRSGFSHNDSGQFGFFFDGKINNQRIVSDATWKILKSKAYGDIKTGKPANYRLPESHVSFNANYYDNDWQTSIYNDEHWNTPIIAGEIGTKPWNLLVKRGIPQWKDFGLKKVKNLEQEGSKIIMKLPYNMQFSYWFKIKAEKNKKINITTDSYSWLSDTPIRAEYITKEGIQEYEHFPWMSGHDVYFVFEEGVEILEAGYRETGYNTEIDGVFEIDDPFMMRLLKKANRTLYVNMRDTYYDCPDRERAQWWGDLVILMEESFYALDNNSLALSKKAINELIDWQKDSGVLFAPVPGAYDKELPQQMLAAISIGFKNYVMYSGDIDTYKAVFPQVKKYLNLWKVDGNGYVNFKEAGWNWSDWGIQIDKVLLEHVWYYLALKTYSDMAEKVGDFDEQKRALSLMKKIKEFVNTNFWSEHGYKSNTYQGMPDERGNAMMVIAGVAQEDQYDIISQVLKSKRNASPYMDRYALEALYLMNKESQALDRIKTRYKKMVDSEYTTLWELFELDNKSYNHGWSGGPLIIMYKFIAGIQPTKIGFEEFQVFPSLGEYRNFSCQFSTVKGLISLDFKTDKLNKSNMKLTVPESSNAIIRIPKNSNNVKIKGKENYIFLKNRQDEQFDYYSLPSGNWIIKYDVL